MIQFLIRRILWTIVVLFGVSVIVFVITYVIPGDPAHLLAGPDPDIENVQRLRRQLGLDDPIWVQYGRFLERLSQGDLGMSWRFREPVLDILIQRLPATAQLALAGVLCELLFGLPIGLIAAFRQNSWLDRVLMTSSFVLLAAPVFVIGLLLLYIFGFLVPIFPLGGYGGLEHLILPAVTIGLAYSPWYARMFRSTILEVLDADFLRTARSKGLPERIVILRHALPNAIRPVITMAGMDLGNFLGGVVVIEVVFGWPGIGARAYEAIMSLDIPVVMGVVLVAAAFTVIMNLLVDISYRIIDPRVTYS